MMEDGAVPCTGTRIRRPCDGLPGFMLFVPGHAGGPARAGGSASVPSCASIPGCDGEIVATPSPFPALDFSSIFDLPSVFRGGLLLPFALRRSALGRMATAGGMTGEGRAACEVALAIGQSLVRTGESAQTAGLQGVIAGSVFAEIGAVVSGPGGAAPGLVLVALAGTLDLAGTVVRLTGAGVIAASTGDYRPVIDALAGFAVGRLAPEITQPFVDTLVEMGLDKALGEDIPMCR